MVIVNESIFTNRYSPCVFEGNHTTQLLIIKKLKRVWNVDESANIIYNISLYDDCVRNVVS